MTIGSASLYSSFGQSSPKSLTGDAIVNERTNESQPASPSWMKDLIIYEIATKGFTSPNGPATGNFNSLRSRLAYLQDLGITGIWLTGYSLCDSNHFFNIWTQYAVIEPNKFDPTLGTEDEFKSLIEEAHRRGIRVFLEVITHGLMDYSPVIKSNPAWFRGSIYGMKEFDWYGGHPDLDDWWVGVYSNFVAKYGVDGFRLDVGICRPDLWERIRRNAAAAGHPIVIWEENDSVIPGVTDFTQKENVIGAVRGGTLNLPLVNDMPGFYDRKFGRSGNYTVDITYADGDRVTGSTDGAGPMRVHLAGLTSDRVSRRAGDFLLNISPGPKQMPDGLRDVQLTVENALRKPVAGIVVQNDMNEKWELNSNERKIRPIFVEGPESYEPLILGTDAKIFIGTLSWGSSIQLSCHDNGWNNNDPYVAQGSRALFGYSFLLSPMIPIFFSGEEFRATFHAQPGLSANEYDSKLTGKPSTNDGSAEPGHWLYGTMLDWAELTQPKHLEMFNDVKKLISVRKENSNILAVCRGGEEANLKAIHYESNITVPVPYVRWLGNKAIIILGNRNTKQDAMVKLYLDLQAIGLHGHNKYKVTDLWGDHGTTFHTEAQLAENMSCTVIRDEVAGGGVGIFEIEPA